MHREEGVGNTETEKSQSSCSHKLHSNSFIWLKAIRHKAPYTALQKSNLLEEVTGRRHQDPVRDPPLHYRAELASSWLPGRAGSISLQLSNFLISLLKSLPLILN